MAGPTKAEHPRIAVVGAGAAGFFGAIAAAETDPGAHVTLHEATDHPLAKVRVSGGGRCTVTHACFDPKELAKGYPRGSRELVGPFHRFGPAETVEWFRSRGVELKTEADGRMFPVTDDSATIVTCLSEAASKAGVSVFTRCGLKSLTRSAQGLEATFSAGEPVLADRVLIATGGGRDSAGFAIAGQMGHTLSAPVPSLFTFHVEDARLKGLEGVSAPSAGVGVRDTDLRSRGPILVTHWGLSGPSILRLSAWGARILHQKDYRFTLGVNWADPCTPDQARQLLVTERTSHAKRHVATSNPFGLPGRLWERLVAAAGIGPDATWAKVSNDAVRALSLQVTASEFTVSGKSMNKEEFVTCGGVRLAEVSMATMESRICPGLYFAGEVLDIDGITGGFNFQAAWTTGWHAGRAMVQR